MGLIDKNAAMEYCGGLEEIYVDVLETFQEELGEQIGRVKALYSQQNWKELVVLVHGIKNSALAAGAMPLSDASKRMEFAGKEDRIADIHAEYDEYVTLMERTLEEAKAAWAALDV